MHTYKYTDKYGNEMDAYLVRASYADDTLAVLMVANPDGYWEEYATLTVNLGFGTKRMAYLDTNNCPWVEQFLNENGLADATGIEQRSGHCTYPLYEFTEKFFDESEVMQG